MEEKLRKLIGLCINIILEEKDEKDEEYVISKIFYKQE
jgi:hypothetical protein